MRVDSWPAMRAATSEISAVTQVFGDPGAAETVGADFSGEAGPCGPTLDHLECGGPRHWLIE